MKNVHTPLAKSVLIPLELTAGAGASATDTAIQKKMFGSGMTTLMISNEKMNDIIKTVQSLKDSGLMIKALAKQLKMKQKQQKGGFLGMLLGILVASLLGNLSTGKDTIRAVEDTIRAGQDF